MQLNFDYLLMEKPFKFGTIVEEQLGFDIPHRSTAQRGD